MDAQIKMERTMVAVEQGDTVHVMVELEAAAAVLAERRPIDVVAVIDRSGSMSGAPLHAAKLAVEQLLRMLGTDDRLAVVAYDDEIRLVLGLTTHDPGVAVEAIRSIRSGGSTNLAGGWLKAFEILSADGRTDAARKILLLTDGQANVGLTKPAALAGLCTGAQQAGIGTSAVGLGEGFDEELLAAMADAGHGNDHFARSAEDLPAIFATEFADLGSIVASNVSIEIRPDPRVALVEIFDDRPGVVVEHGVQVALGDAYGGERRLFVFSLGVPGLAHLGPIVIAEVVLRYVTVDAEAALHAVTMPVVVNVVDAESVDTPNPEVVEQVLLLTAAKARRDARTKLRDGDIEAASAALKEAATRLLEYAPLAADGERLYEDTAALNEKAGEMGEMPMEQTAKTLYSQSRTQIRGRGPRLPQRQTTT